MRRWLKNLLISSLLGLAYTGIDAYQRHEARKNFRKKVEISLERQFSERPKDHLRIRRQVLEITKKQEKILGIKHFGEPEISFDENMPRLKIIAPDGSEKSAVGIYYSDINVIWIDPGRYLQDTLSNELIRTLSHEIGHSHANNLSKSTGNGNWRPKERFFFESFFKNIIGEKLIDEGIAMYFELKTMNENESVSLVHKEFKEYLKIFKGETYYKIGYELVKPILDINVDRGIELLIKNSPTKKDLNDILAYREKILDMMKYSLGN